MKLKIIEKFRTFDITLSQSQTDGKFYVTYEDGDFIYISDFKNKQEARSRIAKLEDHFDYIYN